MNYWKTLEKITPVYLKEHPDEIFVFGDNSLRKGKGGAAKLRDFPNTYGFLTKRYPNNQDSSFYKPGEYLRIFQKELNRLMVEIENSPDKTYLISPIGSGLANRYKIWEFVIRDGLKVLHKYENVRFLY